jgi:hypothetical protein
MYRPLRRGVLAETVPSGKAGADAVFARRTPRGHAHSEDRGLGVLGEHQLIVWPFEAHRAERLTERVVGLLECLTADREALGERFAHADFLRTLAGKDKCNHFQSADRSIRRSADRAEPIVDWVVDVAVAAERRSISPSRTARTAIVTALLTAFGDERP